MHDSKQNMNHLEAVINLAKDAGQRILKIYHDPKTIEILEKQDQTPLTNADMAAHHCIVKGLELLTPEIPVLSEEAPELDFAQRQQWSRYWLVDPLDGTKEFIERNGEFTVNIALIEHHYPVLGVVFWPVENVCYFASQGQGAYKQLDNQKPVAIQCQPWSLDESLVRIAMSRRHGERSYDQFLAQFEQVKTIRMGSSLKFCLLAEGQVDIYPRYGLTSEWDTGAAQCIVEEAGGSVVDLTGKRLAYNCKDSLHNSHFVAMADPRIDWLNRLNSTIMSTR